jgi:hypothetical protein
MAQITQDQHERLQAAAEQLTEKLQVFHEGLTPNEKKILDLVLWHGVAGAAGAHESVAGFAIKEDNPGIIPVLTWVVSAIGAGILYDAVKSIPVDSGGPAWGRGTDFQHGFKQ